MAVRAAASLCVHLARASGCAVLLPGDRRPVEIGHDMGAWPGVHVRLAAGRRVPAAPCRQLSRREAARCSGSRPPPSGARRARSSACPQARATWCRRASCRGPRAAFAVAGCTGYLLGRGARRVAA